MVTQRLQRIQDKASGDSAPIAVGVAACSSDEALVKQGGKLVEVKQVRFDGCTVWMHCWVYWQWCGSRMVSYQW